jgi:hypothetical protein
MIHLSFSMGQPLILFNQKIQLVLYLIIHNYLLFVMTPVITYSLHHYIITTPITNIRLHKRN